MEHMVKNEQIANAMTIKLDDVLPNKLHLLKGLDAHQIEVFG
ncbi:hypothetical protein [Listeria floridensis]|nr:hypothetical protein [Listeria floridensis]